MYAKSFHVSTKDLSIKIRQMIIIQSSNNRISGCLRPTPKLQVWNTYITELPVNLLSINM